MSNLINQKSVALGLALAMTGCAKSPVGQNANTFAPVSVSYETSAWKELTFRKEAAQAALEYHALGGTTRDGVTVKEAFERGVIARQNADFLKNHVQYYKDHSE